MTKCKAIHLSHTHTTLDIHRKLCIIYKLIYWYARASCQNRNVCLQINSTMWPSWEAGGLWNREQLYCPVHLLTQQCLLPTLYLSHSMACMNRFITWFQSNLIRDSDTAAFFFFFLKFYISCAGTEYRLIHVDILIHKLAWNKNEHSTYSNFGEYNNPRGHRIWNRNSEKCVENLCIFPPRFIKHPWFWEAVN